MKYPQLVSTRAVNAISDWLITRLEQLGVDAPLVYSRLLLSLLHTPLQLNALDLAEISDIKVHNLISGRKGGSNRRFSSAETETLKRLAAIDSLNEAISGGGDSLHLEASIERLVDELCAKLREIERQSNIDENYHFEIVADSNADLETMKRSNSPEDPTKRYYRAFPALSKDLKTEQILRMNHKCLSWPASGSNSYYNNNNNISSTNNKNHHSNKLAASDSTATALTASNESSVVVVDSSGTAAGVKRKQKRRRNQAMSKGKSSAAFSGPTGVDAGNDTVNGIVGRNNNSRKSKGTVWDTNFEGAWEMGKDLIREFVLKQNQRNRSISESEASFVREPSKKMSQPNIVQSVEDKTIDDNDDNMFIKITTATVRSAATTNIENDEIETKMIGSQLIRSEGYVTPDTLTSLPSELSLHAPPSSLARRLYEREVSNESLNTSAIGCSGDDAVAMFEAKFDRNVEALWDTADELPQKHQPLCVNNSNVDSFWFKYYKHHYSSDTGTENLSVSLQSNANVNGFIADGQSSAIPTLFANLQQRIVQQKRNNANGNVEAMMPLPTSIWSENPSNEDDVSFYTNAIWRSAAAIAEGPIHPCQLNQSISTTAETKSNEDLVKRTVINGAGDMNQPFGYDMTTLSKWSNCTFETPFIPLVDASASIGNNKESVSSFRSIITSADDVVAAISPATIIPPETIHPHQNSYFYDYKSLPVMSNFKRTIAVDVVGATASTKITLNSYDVDNVVNYNHVDQHPHLFLSKTNYNHRNYKNNNNVSYTNDLTTLVMGSCSVDGGSSLSATEVSLSPAEAKSISLVNHSPTSCFTAVIRGNNNNSVHRIAATIPVETLLSSPLNAGYVSQSQHEQKCAPPPLPIIVSTEEENLLTSERTHFRPIKQTYIDGHTFEIPSDYDDVEFERSSSGSMYLDSAKYMKYSIGVGGGDALPSLQPCEQKAAAASNKCTAAANDFVLKFCVKQNDESCQTDECLPDVNPTDKVMYASGSKSNCRKIQSSILLDIEMDYEMAYIGGSGDGGGVSAAALKNVNELKQQLYKTGNNLNMEQWTQHTAANLCLNNNNTPHTLWEHCNACKCDVVSMPADRKLKDELCADGEDIMSDLKVMRNLYINSDWEDEGEHEDDDDDDDDDEDVTDDDNVLNDCCNDDCCDEKQQNDGNDEEYDDEYENETAYEIKKSIACKIRCKEDEYGGGVAGASDPNDIFYNVNRLISDLLKPDRAKSLVDALSNTTLGNHQYNQTNQQNQQHKHHQQHHHQQQQIQSFNPQKNNSNDNNVTTTTTANFNRNTLSGNGSNACKTAASESAPLEMNHISEKYIGGLWSNNDSGIWRKENEQLHNSADTMAAIWSTYSNNIADNNKSNVLAVDSTIDRNHWEHSNLEEIWNNKLIVDGDGVSGGGVAELSLEISEDQLLQIIQPPLSEHNDFNDCKFEKIDTCNRAMKRDRKRRHSASQNLNEAIDAIAGEYADRKLSSMYSDALKVTTIITCWTLDGSNMAADNALGHKFSTNNGEHDGTSMEVNPSAAILKQMAMISSRPLTR